MAERGAVLGLSWWRFDLADGHVSRVLWDVADYVARGHAREDGYTVGRFSVETGPYGGLLASSALYVRVDQLTVDEQRMVRRGRYE